MTFGNVAPAPFNFSCAQAALPVPASRITLARNVLKFLMFFFFVRFLNDREKSRLSPQIRLLIRVGYRSSRDHIAVEAACLVSLNPEVRHKMDFRDRHVVERAEEERDGII